MGPGTWSCGGRTMFKLAFRLEGAQGDDPRVARLRHVGDRLIGALHLVVRLVQFRGIDQPTNVRARGCHLPKSWLRSWSEWELPTCETRY